MSRSEPLAHVWKERTDALERLVERQAWMRANVELRCQDLLVCK